jgi:hypothetical protein
VNADCDDCIPSVEGKWSHRETPDSSSTTDVAGVNYDGTSSYEYPNYGGSRHEQDGDATGSNTD